MSYAAHELVFPFKNIFEHFFFLFKVEFIEVFAIDPYFGGLYHFDQIILNVIHGDG